jgi:hypothetical protein
VGRTSRDRQSCRRKIRHFHYLSALLHARLLRNDEGLVIYPCPICRNLHVGHMPKRMRPKRPFVPTTPHEKKKARTLLKIARAQQQLAQLQQNLAELLAKESEMLHAEQPHQD